ncbi:MAG: hypothetical protein IT266_03665 [Saprospiraceae bacterium]|nr:hypothetical protein [Saprospiraceae bacterium]
MSLRLITAIAILSSCSGLFLQYSSNPPTGHTGAPGEPTCARSGCHEGGSFTGNPEIAGLPDTLIGGQEYEVRFISRSGSALRTGFQLTVLDDGFSSVGTLSEIPFEKVDIIRDDITRRTYARHASALFYDAKGEASWKFKFKAPASVYNDSLTIYFACMLANANGDPSGDNPIVSKKTYRFKSTVNDEKISGSSFEIALKYEGGTLVFPDDVSSRVRRIQIANATGNIVYSNMGLNVNPFPLKSLLPGLYYVSFHVDGRLYQRAIYHQ